MKKISRRILTLLMAVIMVAATFVPAFAETAEVDDGHDHEQTACAHEHHEQDGEAVESTCTAFGYTRYHCLDCGEYYLSDFKPLKEHEYEVVVVEAANCQQKQITEEQCKNCGAVKPAITFGRSLPLRPAQLPVRENAPFAKRLRKSLRATDTAL